MQKSTLLLLWLLLSFSTMAKENNAKKELETLSSEMNSTEEQYAASKKNKSFGQLNHHSSGDRFICESARSQRQHCYADTSGGVRLIRQIGFSNCQGNWGYDYYGVWVANGCRAEFSVDRYQDHYGSMDGVLRCESYAYQRKFCEADLRGADVSLIHQLSRRNCRGNWGYDDRGIWVSNGCKADFYVRSNSGYDDPYGQPGLVDGMLECRSNGPDINYCQVPDLRSVELVQELNHRGQSCRGNWGYSSHGLWVRRGCQAQFRVTTWHNRDQGYNDPYQREVICESNYGQVKTCSANTSGGVQLVQSLSNTSCHNRWGYDNRGIWVKDGCRARFSLGSGSGHGVPNRPRESFKLKCKSRKYQTKICDTDGPFSDVELIREISKGKYPCDGNWGINNHGELWVGNNCYAEFRVYR